MLRAFLILCFCNFIFFGQAQFYSANSYPPDYHGTKVQSGQRYSKFLNTAAHYNIPLGSKVLLTERKTGRSVIVIVNDRIEEASSNFIISDAAYEALGLELGKQIEVKYKLLEKGQIEPFTNKEIEKTAESTTRNLSMIRIQGVETIQKDKLYLQLGAFSSYNSALYLLNDLGEKHTLPVYLMESNRIYRVLTGSFSDKAEAVSYQNKLKSNSIPSILKKGNAILNN
ncbi:MAG TPA: SPOR domain-containing protein [Saprospiraceae bacterium]|nr:SPOR domain-containing protein [Saprospiraceae bacterium]